MAGGSGHDENSTWVQEVFGGVLTNDTRCLTCETVTSRDEKFLDVSVDVNQNTSITACLRNFSKWETLSGDDKFYCDTCCSLQEAQKCMRLKALPEVLALHLKRFKFFEQVQRYKKLSCRVVFPLELKLPNTSAGVSTPDKLYNLFAVVIHVGSGPSHGHYVSMVKCHGRWLCFDDDVVTPVEPDMLHECFGVTHDMATRCAALHPPPTLSQPTQRTPPSGPHSSPAAALFPDRPPCRHGLCSETSAVAQYGDGLHTIL